MKEADCVAFLQWALPKMQLAWPGFRKVRRSVCKRIERRCRVLGLHDIAEYRERLQSDPSEWDVLQTCCTIPISRFYRDRSVFEALEHAVLPTLASNASARGDVALECWSAGCASGEEAYTLSILWRLRLAERYPRLELRVFATDIEPTLLTRASTACYRASSLKGLPPTWRDAAFERGDDRFYLRAAFRASVRRVRDDLRTSLPTQRLDLILCRNVVFMYFSPDLQARVARELVGRLHLGDAFVIGLHERLPGGVAGIEAGPNARAVFRRTGV